MTDNQNNQQSSAVALRRDYDDIASQALAFAQSGYFKGVAKQSQAAAKILAGRELGFAPWASMSGVHIITTNKGTSVQIGATLLAAAVQRHPRYDYRILDHDDEKCEIQFHVDGEPRTPTSIYTIGDARTAGLIKDGGNWKKVPRNMLFARAMSNGVKWHCPDVFGGAVVYTEGDDIPDQVEVVNVAGPVADMEPSAEVVVEAGVVEPVAAAPEEVPQASLGQLATIAGILDNCEIDREKWQMQMTAAGVVDEGDMTKAQADQLIGWLQAQVGSEVPA